MLKAVSERAIGVAVVPALRMVTTCFYLTLLYAHIRILVCKSCPKFRFLAGLREVKLVPGFTPVATLFFEREIAVQICPPAYRYLPLYIVHTTDFPSLLSPEHSQVNIIAGISALQDLQGPVIVFFA